MSDRVLQRRVLAATSVSYIVVILDTSIVNVALERIAHSLATDIAGLQWIVNAYTLTFASLLLTGGALGDRWGARNTYFAGLLVFTMASALCGFASDLTVLTAARVLQGVGAALLVHAWSEPGERARAIGIWVGAGGAALAAGPLVGGVLIHLFGWRSIFLANVPIGLAGAWLTSRITRDQQTMTTRPLDLAGQMTAIVALGSLIGVLIEGGGIGWRSLPIVAGGAVCVAAWIVFIAIETRRAQPMLPLSFFADRVFVSSAIAAMTTALTSFGIIFVLSLYFQQVRGYSPLWTGLAFLPLTVVVTGGNMISGRLVKAHGARWPVLVGLLLQAAGFAGLLLSSPTSPYWLVALPMPAIGLGGGFITPAATASLMSTVEKSRAGMAAGVLNSARQTGAALGVAIFGTLLAAHESFDVGMRAVLWTATAMSLAAALVWWRVVFTTRRQMQARNV